MKVDGRCHCGGIAYEATVDPATATVCHCTDCQMLTGTGYRVGVRAPADAFRLLRGEPRTYVKTADSGTKRVHAFCPDCGTPVYSTQLEPTTYTLRIGCLTQRASLPPLRQQWCRSAVPWSKSLAEVPVVVP
jgi:hypothetical protein